MFKHVCLLLLTICFLYTATAQTAETDSLLRVLDKLSDDTTKAKTLGALARTLRSTDPAKAIQYGKVGIQLSRKLGFDKGTAMCYLNVSAAYIYSDKQDTALVFLDTALQYALKVGDPNRLGLAYLNRADIYRQQQNFMQSMKDCETALAYADKANNDDVRARINQTLGAIYYQQEIYLQSMNYYEKAMSLYRKEANMRMTAIVLNNIGLIHKSNGDFNKAIKVIEDAIHILDSLQDITNLSIFNGNLSDSYYLMGNYDSSGKYAARSMEYAVMQNNEKLKAIAWAFMANTYLKQKRYAEAVDVSTKAMVVFKKIDDIDRINTTADMLAEVYALSGNYVKAYEYMRVSKTANDTLVKWKYDDDIAAMQTKFKIKEKDKEILLLAKDKELQQQKILRQRLMLFGSIAILLLALIGIWLLLNRNKLRQSMKELELRNQIAADLHDEVGSSLSSIHMLSQMATEQSDDSTQQNILTRMSSNAKETMEKMSDIVWMIKPGETEAGNLKQRMEHFAYEICSTKNIEIKMELNELDKCKFSMEQRKNIYLIFKEALNNAVKYSGTDKIQVITSIKNKELLLQVKDFGKGFENNIANKGNGLDNMKNRAKEMNGTLELRSSQGGTSINLVVPV